MRGTYISLGNIGWIITDDGDVGGEDTILAKHGWLPKQKPHVGSTLGDPPARSFSIEDFSMAFESCFDPRPPTRKGGVDWAWGRLLFVFKMSSSPCSGGPSITTQCWEHLNSSACTTLSRMWYMIHSKLLFAFEFPIFWIANGLVMMRYDIFVSLKVDCVHNHKCIAATTR